MHVLLRRLTPVKDVSGNDVAAARGLTRRSFVGWLAAVAPALRGVRLPAFVRRRVEIDANQVRALASAVLPAELGPPGIAREADAFVKWIREYRAGAELSHGYGSARIRSAGASPETRWALQLSSLDDDARKAHGNTFVAITDEQRRAIVRAQLAADNVNAMGNVAQASHVAVALLAHFYDSMAATDLCYDAQIGKDACRPLSQSSQQPVPLRRRVSGTGRGDS